MRSSTALAGTIAALALAVPATSLAKPSAPVVVPDNPMGLQAHREVVARAANVGYDGGPVLHSNRTHLIFWQPDGSGLSFVPGYMALTERFLFDVAAASHETQNVYGLTGQYTDDGGPAAYDARYAGAVLDTDRLPANGCTEPALPPAGTGPGWKVCLTDAQLEQEIDHVVEKRGLPNSGDDIYFLVMPDGFGSCLDSTSSSCALGGSPNGYCSYHFETTDGLLYAVLPYPAISGHCQSTNPRPNLNPADLTVDYVSHENIETITDPDEDAWIDSSGGEIGDLCLTRYGPSLGGSGDRVWNETIHGGHFYLQEEWSNFNRSCQPRAKLDPLSFIAPDRASIRKTVHLSARATDPDGRIVAYGWFFGDGKVGHGRNVSHRFRRPGRYRVVVRTTDSWGNWSFSASWITVYEPKPR